MCTAFPRVLTTTQNSEKFSKNQLQSLKYYPEQKSDYCVKEKSQTNQNKPHQCGSHASKWKLRKRKHLHFCVGILYFSYGKKTDFFFFAKSSHGKFLHLFWKISSNGCGFQVITDQRCNSTSFLPPSLNIGNLSEIFVWYEGKNYQKTYGLPSSIMICNSLVVKSFSNIRIWSTNEA